MKKATIEEVKSKFYQKWGYDLYDYSQFTEYKGNKVKIPIKCKRCGKTFPMTPNNHLSGYGCKDCGILSHTLKVTKDYNLFIEEANKVHNYKYTYQDFLYKNNHTTGLITCPVHGNFQMTPKNHLRGQGCKYCAKHQSWASSKEEFVKKAIQIFGDKYDYEQSVYVNNKTEIEVRCKKCNTVFNIRPDLHLFKKTGCPICNASHLEEEIRMLLKGEKVEYIEQAGKRTLPWIGQQKLDFYLPQYKVGIECQGLQHFQEVKHFGGEEEFKKIQKRDKLKLEKCVKNGITLLYYSNLSILFPYKVFTTKEDLLLEIKGSK